MGVALGSHCILWSHCLSLALPACLARLPCPLALVALPCPLGRAPKVSPGLPLDAQTQSEVLLAYRTATELDPQCYTAWHQWGMVNFRIMEHSNLMQQTRDSRNPHGGGGRVRSESMGGNATATLMAPSPYATPRLGARFGNKTAGGTPPPLGGTSMGIHPPAHARNLAAAAAAAATGWASCGLFY